MTAPATPIYRLRTLVADDERRKRGQRTRTPAETRIFNIITLNDISLFNEDQPRDDDGKFTSGGGGGEEKSEPDHTRPGEDMPSSHAEVTAWPEVKGPLGSQGGTWHKNPENGKTYLVKPTKSLNHAQNEIAAGIVYRVAGIPFPNTAYVQDTKGNTYTVSEKVEDLQQLKQSEWDENPDAQAAAARDFGVDALLSHWDVGGLEADNTLLGPDDTPVRIESGGAMAYRAMGGPKDSFTPNAKWVEPESMRTSEQGRHLYGDMTDRQVAASLGRALAVDLDEVRAVWQGHGIPDKVSQPWYDTLKARQDQIPDLIAGLKQSFSLARLDALVAATCHMPAGSEEGGQFVSCDTPGAVDQSGEMPEQQVQHLEFLPGTPEYAKANPGAGPLDKMKNTGPTKSNSVGYALWKFKNDPKGQEAAKNVQHIGKQSVYPYPDDKWKSLVVTPDPSGKGHTYELVAPGQISQTLAPTAAVAEAVTTQQMADVLATGSHEVFTAASQAAAIITEPVSDPSDPKLAQLSDPKGMGGLIKEIKGMEDVPKNLIAAYTALAAGGYVPQGAVAAAVLNVANFGGSEWSEVQEALGLHILTNNEVAALLEHQFPVGFQELGFSSVPPLTDVQLAMDNMGIVGLANHLTTVGMAAGETPNPSYHALLGGPQSSPTAPLTATSTGPGDAVWPDTYATNAYDKILNASENGGIILSTLEKSFIEGVALEGDVMDQGGYKVLEEALASVILNPSDVAAILEQQGVIPAGTTFEDALIKMSELAGTVPPADTGAGNYPTLGEAAPLGAFIAGEILANAEIGDPNEEAVWQEVAAGGSGILGQGEWVTVQSLHDDGLIDTTGVAALLEQEFGYAPGTYTYDEAVAAMNFYASGGKHDESDYVPEKAPAELTGPGSKIDVDYTYEKILAIGYLPTDDLGKIQDAKEGATGNFDTHTWDTVFKLYEGGDISGAEATAILEQQTGVQPGTYPDTQEGMAQVSFLAQGGGEEPDTSTGNNYTDVPPSGAYESFMNTLGVLPGTDEDAIEMSEQGMHGQQGNFDTGAWQALQDAVNNGYVGDLAAKAIIEHQTDMTPNALTGVSLSTILDALAYGGNLPADFAYLQGPGAGGAFAPIASGAVTPVGGVPVTGELPLDTLNSEYVKGLITIDEYQQKIFDIYDITPPPMFGQFAEYAKDMYAQVTGKSLSPPITSTGPSQEAALLANNAPAFAAKADELYSDGKINTDAWNGYKILGSGTVTMGQASLAAALLGEGKFNNDAWEKVSNAFQHNQLNSYEVAGIIAHQFGLAPAQMHEVTSLLQSNEHPYDKLMSAVDFANTHPDSTVLPTIDPFDASKLGSMPWSLGHPSAGNFSPTAGLGYAGVGIVAGETVQLSSADWGKLHEGLDKGWVTDEQALAVLTHQFGGGWYKEIGENKPMEALAKLAAPASPTGLGGGTLITSPQGSVTPAALDAYGKANIPFSGGDMFLTPEQWAKADFAFVNGQMGVKDAEAMLAHQFGDGWKSLIGVGAGTALQGLAQQNIVPTIPAPEPPVVPGGPYGLPNTMAQNGYDKTGLPPDQAFTAPMWDMMSQVAGGQITVDEAVSIITHQLGTGWGGKEPYQSMMTQAGPDMYDKIFAVTDMLANMQVTGVQPGVSAAQGALAQVSAVDKQVSDALSKVATMVKDEGYTTGQALSHVFENAFTTDTFGLSNKGTGLALDAATALRFAVADGHVNVEDAIKLAHGVPMTEVLFNGLLENTGMASSDAYGIIALQLGLTYEQVRETWKDSEQSVSPNQAIASAIFEYSQQNLGSQANAGGGQVFGDMSKGLLGGTQTPAGLQGASWPQYAVKPDADARKMILEAKNGKAAVEWHGKDKNGFPTSKFQIGNRVLTLTAAGTEVSYKSVLDRYGNIAPYMPAPNLQLTQVPLETVKTYGMTDATDFLANMKMAAIQAPMSSNVPPMSVEPVIKPGGAGDIPKPYTVRDASGKTLNKGSREFKRLQALNMHPGHAAAYKHVTGPLTPEDAKLLGAKVPTYGTVTGYTKYKMHDGFLTVMKVEGAHGGMSTRVAYTYGPNKQATYGWDKPNTGAMAPPPVTMTPGSGAMIPQGGVFYGNIDASAGIDHMDGGALLKDNYGAPGTAAEAWGDKTYGTHATKSLYTTGEWSSLTSYSNSGFGGINGGLRHDNPPSTAVRNLDTALAKTPTKEPVITYRKGLGSYESKVLSLPVGGLFREKGFMSTSTAGRWSGNVALRIEVPPGTPAAWKPGLTHPGEFEMLLPRGMILVKTGEGEVHDGIHVIPMKLVAIGAEPVDVAAALGLTGLGLVGSLYAGWLLDVT